MKIQNILISQPKPVDFEKSPYAEIAKKHNVEIDFVKFFSIEEVPATEFRKHRINILDFTAIVLMSKNAIDHFFRLAKELRIDIPDSMKYFCINESTALYLQRYITYRKRKIFFSKSSIPELVEIIVKHKNEKYLIPTADLSGGVIATAIAQHNIPFTPAPMFASQSVDLKTQVEIDKYQLVVIFSPVGMQSLMENYPDFKDKGIEIAALGSNTCSAIETNGFLPSFMAPTPECPSITIALDNYLKKANKVSKKQ